MAMNSALDARAQVPQRLVLARWLVGLGGLRAVGRWAPRAR